ncbi:hypothetical protein GCM10007423_03130 [Dyadobacter endophyticus]|uniref:Uncharacterized protein n=1 Tax=Dyadobacter endophyticus TaxID=1749036 RepID=A0ABQ1YET0_9BACT|nr:hypothetical protein [Dyadobacter endophyticus]GGH21758.1 hypothetical protein GCM10007423_03130 [Dyadobacter endophyticus]
MINSALPKDASYPSLCSDILPRATLPTMVTDPTTYITHRVDFSQVNAEHFSLQRPTTFKVGCRLAAEGMD